MEESEIKTITSNADLESIAAVNIGVNAEYAFQNPQSINGPFGTMEITISGKGNDMAAFGNLKINTLWGLGSVTKLQFNGPSHFDPGTGYTTVNVTGAGVITVMPQKQKHIKAKIAISLEPGFKNGKLSVEGFFSNFHIKATAIHYISI